MRARLSGVTIIKGLIAEHRVFLTIFDQIEHMLPDIKTTGEMKLLCRLLAGLLQEHGGAERDLAYIALDHILHEHNRLTRLNHDHQELDGLLSEVEQTKDLPKARLRLKVALDANRAHFEQEERVLFPQLEEVLQYETLLVLGKVWKKHAYRH